MLPEMVFERNLKWVLRETITVQYDTVSMISSEYDIKFNSKLNPESTVYSNMVLYPTGTGNLKKYHDIPVVVGTVAQKDTNFNQWSLYHNHDL